MNTTQINIRLTNRHLQMVNELADVYGSQSSAMRIAIEKLYEQTSEMNEMKQQFVNDSDRYGPAVPVTINDYRELNPDGVFYQTSDGIYERFSDKPGDQEKIASRQ